MGAWEHAGCGLDCVEAQERGGGGTLNDLRFWRRYGGTRVWSTYSGFVPPSSRCREQPCSAVVTGSSTLFPPPCQYHSPSWRPLMGSPATARTKSFHVSSMIGRLSARPFRSVRPLTLPDASTSSPLRRDVRDISFSQDLGSATTHACELR